MSAPLSVIAKTAVLAALALATGCWKMQDAGQWAADGGGSGDTEETDGMTDPDTGWLGQWTYVEMETPTEVDLAAVWGTAFHNAYAVGEDGVILHFDGTGWSLVDYEADAHPNLHAIAGASADLIWAAGVDRVMLEFDGEQWTQLDTGWELLVEGSWRGLCVADDHLALAVGDHMSIMVYDGDSWGSGISADEDVTVAFHAAACVSNSDSFVAGHDHAAFSSSVLARYEVGFDWQLMAHESIDNMYGMAGGSGIWAVGFDDGLGSRLYRKNGDEFVVETTSNHELLGLWAHSTLGVWAVGNTSDDDAIGVVEAWDTNGDPQYELVYDGATRLRGIWGVDNGGDRHLFAVGKSGTILHIFWDPL